MKKLFETMTFNSTKMENKYKKAHKNPMVTEGKF